MAERRMFAKTVINSDGFLNMPLSAQALYFHLGISADDDGFVNNPKMIQRMINANQDDLTLLVTRGFVIPFKSGIVVITHWKIHNYIRLDRYKPTICKEEKALITEEEDKTYILLQDYSPTHGIPMVDQRETQYRLSRLSSKEKEEDSPSHLYGNFSNVLLHEEGYKELKSTFEQAEDLINMVSEYLANSERSYKNHLALVYKIARANQWPKRPKIITAETIVQAEAVEAIGMPEDIRQKMEQMFSIPEKKGDVYSNE